MQNLLIRLGACEEVREWVGGRTLSEAWAECERPDWMLWLHARSESADAGAYAALARAWAEAAEAAAEEAEAAEAAWAAAAEAADAARAAKAALAAAAEAAAWAAVAEAWAAVAAAWAAAAEAKAASEAVRVRQCDDIRAALCCPVFENNE